MHLLETKLTPATQLDNLRAALQGSSAARPGNKVAARGGASTAGERQYVSRQPTTQMTATWGS
jgi:hypothetical protein